MSTPNSSDLIEAYLKALIESSGFAEIKRMEVATHFNVVPSQINYVINTRFTLRKGYSVESKRGGGGYIRIVKMHLNDSHQFLKNILETIPKTLSDRESYAIVQQLYENDIITRPEANLIICVVTCETFSEEIIDKIDLGILRADLIRAFLRRLIYQDQENE